MNIALLATAWGPKFGGINAFNKDFAIGLAEELGGSGRVFCAVPDPQDQDIEDAKGHRVTLIPIRDNRYEGESDDSLVHEILQWLRKHADGTRIDWWVGHDVKSGDTAVHAAAIAGGSTALIHHMSYDAYQGYVHDLSAEADTKQQQQKKLFKQQAELFAVGPLLQRSCRILSGRKVTQLVPGFPDTLTNCSPDDTVVAVTFGRMEQASDRIKQGRLAVAAFGQAINRMRTSDIRVKTLARPRLYVIGLDAESQEEEVEIRKLADRYAKAVVDVLTLPFDQDRNRLMQQLGEANVALMLSWHEGFGLTGWEAVAAEVPLILSKHSGLYQLIEDTLPGAGPGCVMSVNVQGRRGEEGTDNFTEDDLEAVSTAIRQIGANLEEQKKSAHLLKELLIDKLGCTWGDTARQFLDTLSGTVYIKEKTQELGPHKTQPLRKRQTRSFFDLEPFTKRLRALSDKTAMAGGWITDDPQHPLDFSRLYVVRDIESSIFRKVQTVPGCTVLTGEAGSGKTSLLWHIHKRLQSADIPAIFLRADTAVTLNLQELCLSLEEIRSTKGHLVLLIDTADAIVGVSEHHDKLLKVIDNVSTLGCSIIVSSRPNEANLYLPGYDRTMIRDNYSKSEFAHVVEAHAKHLSRHFDPRSVYRQVKKLQEIVSQGQPAKYIVMRPLLLRMLFLLYTEIPTDINTALLYSRFWERRVETDWRAGQPKAEPGAVDYTQAALAIASEMVRFGTGFPLSEDVVHRVLDETPQCQRADIDHLVSRGVMCRVPFVSQSDGICFFHQTFFEHAAARSLITCHKADGIDLLINRLRNYPGDHLRFPILEHTLALSQSSEISIQKRGQEHMETILRDGPPHLQRAAVVCYAQMHQVPSPLRDVFSASLGERQLAVDFVRSTPSTPLERLDEVWDCFKKVWSDEAEARNLPNPWAVRRAVLEQLPRLANRVKTSVVEVAGFLQDHNVVGSIQDNMVPDVVDVLMACVESEPSTSLSLLEKLFRRLWNDNPGQENLASVAIAIAHHPNASSALLQEIDDKLSSYTKISVCRARGVLQAELCRRKGIRRIDDVLTLSNPYGACELSLLAAWLFDERDDRWDQVWKYFASNVDVLTCREWVQHLWDRLGKSSLDKADIPSVRASEYLAARVSSAIVGTEAAERRAGVFICQYSLSFELRIAILQAVLESRSEPLSVTDFLTPDTFGMLLGPAIAINVPELLNVDILQEVTQHKEMKKRLLMDINSLVTRSPECANKITPFLIECGEFQRMESVIKEGIVKLRALPGEAATKLSEDIMKRLSSPSVQKRQMGARWAFYGLTQALGIVLEFDKLLQVIDSTKDKKVIAWLVMTLLQLSKSREELDKAFTLALSTVREGDELDEGLRDQVFEVLLERMINEQRLEDMDSVIDAMERDFNGPKIRAVASAIPRIAALNKQEASKLTYLILTLPSLQNSGVRVIQTFRIEIKKPLIKWSLQADIKDLLLLVGEIESLNEQIGQFILDVIYQPPHAADLRDPIIRLADNPKISNKLKRFIPELFRRQDSADGSGYWDFPVVAI